MATSGWQNEQTWYTYSSNVYLIGNIYVSSITHSGTNLRIQGTIAGGARGTNNYYFSFYDYTSYAQPEGGSKLALGSKGRQWKVGQADVHVNFDVTLTGVPTTTTSRSFYVNFYGPNTNSVVATLRWTLNFDASGSAPSGGYIAYNSSTWNSITFTSGVTSWGGLNGQNHAAVFTGTTNGQAASATTFDFARREYFYDGTQATSHQTVATDGNTSQIYGGAALSIKGLLCYRLGYWVSNAAGSSESVVATTRYLPPAPPKFTYTDPGGTGTKVFSVTFTGDTANNHTTYDTASLTRTVRYKVDNASSWTYVANGAQATVGANTTFNVSIPASKSAVIEGWQTYHGMQSQTKTLNLYNGNAPSRVYGSVNGKSKLLVKMYGSVNGKSKKITKLYASVNGKSKRVLG